MQEVASNLTEYQKGNYILTDDQAPVELLGMQVIDELIKDEVQYYKDIYKERGIKGLMESLCYLGATWKSVNHENLACAYKWDFDFGYEQVAKADCEYPLD